MQHLFLLNGKKIPEKPYNFGIFPVYIEIWNPVNQHWVRYFDESKNGDYLANVLVDFFSPCFVNISYASFNPEAKGEANQFSWLKIHAVNQNIKKIQSAEFNEQLVWLRRLNNFVTKTMNSGTQFLNRAEHLMFKETQRKMESMKKEIENMK